MKFLVDVREKKLIALLKKSKYDIEVKSLPIGDIIMYNDKDQAQVIIERKTIADMYASFRDGRYKEQRQRILESNIPLKIILVEGNNLNDNRRHFNEHFLTKSLTSIFLKERLKLIRTLSIQETAVTLEHIFSKINNLPLQDDPSTEGDCSIQLARKDKITPKVYFQSSLTLIPGVSYKVAKEICAPYNSLQEFVTDLDLKKLQSIVLESTKNKRKLGKALATKIVSFMTNSEIKK